jgi:hypothetical protein
MQGQVVGVSPFYFPAFMLGSFFLVFIPANLRLRRTVIPVWCLSAIAGMNVIAWWYFAFKPWPTDEKAGLLMSESWRLGMVRIVIEADTEAAFARRNNLMRFKQRPIATACRSSQE